VRSEGRINLRQVIVFVAVALVLNVQFTWWVMRSLAENEERLALQHTAVELRARAAALHLGATLAQAGWALERQPAGQAERAAEPWVAARKLPTSAEPGFRLEGEEVRYRVPLPGGGHVEAVLDPEAPGRWLADFDPELRLLAAGSEAGTPAASLAPPLERWVVSLEKAKWEEVLSRYRQRIVVVVAQGALLVTAMIVAIVLVWTAVRREGQRERQHQNFVSAVTHELKTPLAGIRLALETVLSGRVDEEGRERFLRNALIDAERLSGLVQKVLEVTRFAGGAHRLAVELGDFSELVAQEVASAARRAEAREVMLEAKLEEGVQAPFDDEAMAIVCSNLMENALKYAARGNPPRVRVTLALVRGEAVLEVSDNGVGIEGKDLEAIFQPFYRANDEVTRRTPGTGIGLYVAREIVAAHGGKLTASSRGRGQGATFRLTLPGASRYTDEEFTE
jgi:signal transduction histidine kinase